MLKSQICPELQTLRDWGDKNVQIQSETKAPPKKNERKFIMEQNTVIHTSHQHLWLCHIGEEVSCCCKIDGRLTENMTRHDLDREKWSVFKQKFIKYGIKSFRCYRSEM